MTFKNILTLLLVVLGSVWIIVGTKHLEKRAYWRGYTAAALDLGPIEAGPTYLKTYPIDPGSPDGLLFSGVRGEYRWTPAEPGTLYVRYRK